MNAAKKYCDFPYGSVKQNNVHFEIFNLLCSAIGLQYMALTVVVFLLLVLYYNLFGILNHQCECKLD